MNELLGKIRNRSATVGIVGLGYVGLPLVLTFGRKKIRCIGFDIDTRKIAALERGESYIKTIPRDSVDALIQARLLEPTDDFSRASECDAIVLCVPTPLTEHREPDMSFVESTARSIGPHLHEGQLVVLESTTYPGTTNELLKNILQDTSGLRAGQQFHLAYSPEREDPGNPDFDTQRIPKLVGGLTPECRSIAAALYSSVLDEVIEVSTTQIAELAKLFENIFRSVNIALVNELKLLCDRMDIDVWEVIRAASSKPFGFMPFYPGPGLGGHCIPIDPFYLTWKAREYGFSTRFIELAGEINASMPRYVVYRSAQALNSNKKAMHGAKVLVLGVAYKRDVDDMRESPALEIIELLQAQGAEVGYHDPYVPKLPRVRRHNLNLESVALTEETLRACDLAIIVTDHRSVDYAYVLRHAPLVVDTRNATSELPNRDKVTKA